MKIIALGLLLTLFACKQDGKKPELNSKIAELEPHLQNHKTDSLKIKESNHTNDNICDFDKYLNNNNTSNLARAIYLDEPWDLNNDKESLALFDSLKLSKNKSRPFYFKVLTKSYAKSDGYFSEGLGLVGYDFVENNTKEFASYFDSEDCFSDKDLETWANIVLLEMMGDGGNDSLVDNYNKKLISNCKESSTNQKLTIGKFSNLIQTKWQEYLKVKDE